MITKIEEVELKLMLIGGQDAVILYRSNDINFKTLLTALTAGISIEEIEEAISIQTMGLSNNQKIDVLIVLRNMRKGIL